MSAMVRVEITPELLRQCVDRNVHYSPECCTYAAFHITERFPDTWRTGCQLLESAVENFDSDPEFAFQRATQWGHDEFTQIEIDSYLLNETERRREPYSEQECERVAAYITEHLFVSRNGGWSLVSEALQATGHGDREENPKTNKRTEKTNAALVQHWEQMQRAAAALDARPLKERLAEAGRDLAEKESKLAKASAALIKAEGMRDAAMKRYRALLDEEMNGVPSRTENPSRSGLSLGTLAVGAALGAGIMHYTMRSKP